MLKFYHDNPRLTRFLSLVLASLFTSGALAYPEYAAILTAVEGLVVGAVWFPKSGSK